MEDERSRGGNLASAGDDERFDDVDRFASCLGARVSGFDGSGIAEVVALSVVPLTIWAICRC